MAPVAHTDQDTLEHQLKETIQGLYNILVQVTAYDTIGSSTRPSKEVLASSIQDLDGLLQSIHNTASTPSPESSLAKIPQELIQYVEQGRNPDIYTREFVEQVRRHNQLLKGKQSAFASFRDVLADEMEKAMPELREDTARVVQATGGTGSQLNI